MGRGMVAIGANANAAAKATQPANSRSMDSSHTRRRARAGRSRIRDASVRTASCFCMAAAVLKASHDPTVIEMPTSTGANRKMRRAGTLEFTLKGQALKLTALNEVGQDPSHLFVPFSDLTSGTETYAAGRFMDLNRNGTGIYEVDFNRAYIPYCYYSPTYECPYPPPENRLQIPIRAGERMKK